MTERLRRIKPVAKNAKKCAINKILVSFQFVRFVGQQILERRHSIQKRLKAPHPSLHWTDILRPKSITNTRKYEAYTRF